MYGYVRPAVSELRVREYEQFRSAYCGLCEALRRRYGPLSRFIVNYDFTFLAMAMTRTGAAERRRCPAHPLRRRYCLCRSEALDRAADYSVILAWWKLRDNVRDEGFLRALGARLGCWLLRGAYRKAARLRSRFAENVENYLLELTELEEQRSDSLDRTADCFARILSGAAEEEPDENRKRIWRELFYHVGRTVYILDAVDDYKEDSRQGSFNPLCVRWPSADGSLSPEAKGQLRGTLNLSQHSAAAALLLREPDEWQPILENIIMTGLPAVTQQVFQGTWKTRPAWKDRSDLIHRREETT